ncbi:MAG: cytochrome B5, partial [Nitrospirae bacterium]
MKSYYFHLYLIIQGLFLLVLFSRSSASVDYARQTGHACSVCHIDPADGGPLTKAGKSFREGLKQKGLYRPLSTFKRIVRFVIGFLHLFTAIVWFGAILYVHILLKLAYAARGLPKGELMVGWASIIIMGITGTLLTIARIPTLHALFHTRFGILLSIKIVLYLTMVSTAAVVTFIIGPKLRRRRLKAVTSGTESLTLEELQQFDGKEGRPSYVAVQGKIYDLSESRLWKGGSHARKHLAGADLSDALKKAPHGIEKLKGFPVVGEVVKGAEKKMPAHQRVFYFMAYMNLVIVFLIIFIVSLWR